MKDGFLGLGHGWVATDEDERMAVVLFTPAGAVVLSLATAESFARELVAQIACAKDPLCQQPGA